MSGRQEHRLALSSYESGGTDCYRVVDLELDTTAQEHCPSWQLESDSMEVVGASSDNGGFTVLRLPISAEVIDASGPWERTGSWLVIEWGTSARPMSLTVKNMEALFDCEADPMNVMHLSCTMQTPDGPASPTSEE